MLTLLYGDWQQQGEILSHSAQWRWRGNLIQPMSWMRRLRPGPQVRGQRIELTHMGRGFLRTSDTSEAWFPRSLTPKPSFRRSGTQCSARRRPQFCAWGLSEEVQGKQKQLTLERCGDESCPPPTNLKIHVQVLTPPKTLLIACNCPEALVRR